MATAGCLAAALDWKSISCAAHEIEFVCEYNYLNFLFLFMFVHVRACRASLVSLSLCQLYFLGLVVVFVLKLNYSV